jgi:hypothetical protein
VKAILRAAVLRVPPIRRLHAYAMEQARENQERAAALADQAHLVGELATVAEERDALELQLYALRSDHQRAAARNQDLSAALHPAEARAQSLLAAKADADAALSAKVEADGALAAKTAADAALVAKAAADAALAAKTEADDAVVAKAVADANLASRTQAEQASTSAKPASFPSCTLSSPGA